MNFSIKKCLLGAAVLGLISGCGGGDSSSAPAASTLSGLAAVGSPIVNGAVKVVCAVGSALDTQTDATGAGTVTRSGQTLPCAVEVSGGTIGTGGAANASAYHSVATSAGTVNVTPLSDLLIANLSGVDPSTWFAGVSASSLGQINSAALSTSLTKIRTVLAGLTALGSIDPITLPFTAASGNAIDDMLSALWAALASSGVSYSSLLSAATASTISVPAGLGTALSAAYANTTSGGGTKPSNGSGCTGAVATFFAANVRTSTGTIATYNATPNATPTVLGVFANGTTASVTVHSDCTVTVGNITLTAWDGTFFNANNQVDVDMAGIGFRFGHFEKFQNGTSLLGFQDPTNTDAVQFSLP
ncbi:hypothetical protein GALL_458120 [mine drainage metagenome]|uniref:Lipoprotein n=1 Tax=mine drainage metagenome TaxID=410659 RepID=A0A1J5PP40_9ZZZZ